MAVNIYFSIIAPTTRHNTLSLHDALPILDGVQTGRQRIGRAREIQQLSEFVGVLPVSARSEEHTSELQSPYDLVCRLLLEKKKPHVRQHTYHPYRSQLRSYDRTNSLLRAY